MIANVKDLATGTTPVLTAKQAQQILQQRGAFPEIVPQDVIVNQGGDPPVGND